ncbi:MAG: hypothetical protein HGA45_35380 [Chloroflexales bacterium]|nr:hypothetical protein [Chloroflexales bacterium]
MLQHIDGADKVEGLRGERRGARRQVEEAGREAAPGEAPAGVVVQARVELGQGDAQSVLGQQ